MCTGCGQGTFDSAQLEELQNNKEHAMELYEKVMKRYPKSEYARKAEERMKELTELKS